MCDSRRMEHVDTLQEMCGQVQDFARALADEYGENDALVAQALLICSGQAMGLLVASYENAPEASILEAQQALYSASFRDGVDQGTAEILRGSGGLH